MQACLWQRGLSLLSVPYGGRTLILIIVASHFWIKFETLVVSAKTMPGKTIFSERSCGPTISSTDPQGPADHIFGTSGLQYSGARLHGKLWHARSFVSVLRECFHSVPFQNAPVDPTFVKLRMRT